LFEEEKRRRAISGGIHLRALPVGYRPREERWEKEEVLRRTQSVFGLDFRTEEVDQGLTRVQQDFSELDKLPPTIKMRVMGRLKAILSRREEARFQVCQREENGTSKLAVRLCLLKPEEVFSSEFIEGIRREIGRKVIIKRELSQEDFEEGGILAGCQAAKEIFDFQNEFEAGQGVSPGLGLPVFWTTKCFYRITVVIEEAERRRQEILEIECPGILKQLQGERFIERPCARPVLGILSQ